VRVFKSAYFLTGPKYLKYSIYTTKNDRFWPVPPKRLPIKYLWCYEDDFLWTVARDTYRHKRKNLHRAAIFKGVAMIILKYVRSWFLYPGQVMSFSFVRFTKKTAKQKVIVLELWYCTYSSMHETQIVTQRKTPWSCDF